jgi:glucose-6-phosphate isomerase
MEPLMQKAFQDMEAIESGAIANPDEKRMVGHYWLRAPELAPRRKMTRVVSDALKTSKDPISPLSLKKYPILFSIPDRRMKNFFQIQFKLACVG